MACALNTTTAMPTCFPAARDSALRLHDMVSQPKILVADEPPSALEVSIQAQVLNLFMDLQDQLRTAK